MTHPNFHLKTFIAGNLICDGSHNWLSAVTELDHEANNLEMSVALRGDIACELIKTFEETELGKFALNSVKKPLPRVKVNPKNNFINIKQPFPYLLKKSAEKSIPKIKTYPQKNTTPKQPSTYFPNTTKKRDNSTQHHYSQKVSSKKPKTTHIPMNFDNIIKMFSGEKVGKEGYCVRFNKDDYLRDDEKNIRYFDTGEKAKKAAYKWWEKQKK